MYVNVPVSAGWLPLSGMVGLMVYDIYFVDVYLILFICDHMDVIL